MNNVVVILAGGSGSRLWPLATDVHPKLLLKTLSNETMLDATLFRARLFTDDVFVVTGSRAEYADFRRLGIDDEKVIVEPDGADTAAAIAYSIAHIKKKYGSDVVVTLLPVDHQIRNHGAFYRDITFALRAAASYRRVTLFGVTPSFPATGYGYIKLGDEVEHHDRSSLFRIDQFLEKPDEKLAKRFLKEADFVWNSGIYMGTVDAFERVFQKSNALDDWYTTLHEKNAAMPEQFRKFQFDRELIEGNANNLQVVTATFDWKDIGTYEELYRSALETDEHENAIRADAVLKDCSRCLVIGGDKKIVALGLDDIAIIDGGDGILVCQKSKYSQYVGKVATGKEQPENHHG